MKPSASWVTRIKRKGLALKAHAARLRPRPSARQAIVGLDLRPYVITPYKFGLRVWDCQHTTLPEEDGTRKSGGGASRSLLLEMRRMMAEGYWEDFRDVELSLEDFVFVTTCREIDRINWAKKQASKVVELRAKENR